MKSYVKPKLIVHLVDGTYELFRHFYGLRRFNKGVTALTAPLSACCRPCSR